MNFQIQHDDSLVVRLLKEAVALFLRVRLVLIKKNTSTDTKLRINMYRMLLSQLKRGVAPRTALYRLYHEITTTRPKDKAARAYGYWYQQMDLTGCTLTEAMEEWVPTTEIMLIRSGEVVGQLSNGLAAAEKEATTASHISKLIVKASIMPMILALMAYGSIIFMATSLLPSVADLVPIEEWPSFAVPYRIFAEFMAANAAPITGFIVISLIIIFATFNTFKGEVRSQFDSMPPWSLHQRLNSARFLASFSGLLSKGESPFDALMMLQESSSPYVGWHIREILSRFSDDGDLGSSLISTNLFDYRSNLLIRTSSEDSNFTKNITILSEEIIEGVTEFVENFAAVSQAVFLVLTGVSVGWALLSIGSVVMFFYTSQMGQL